MMDQFQYNGAKTSGTLHKGTFTLPVPVTIEIMY